MITKNSWLEKAKMAVKHPTRAPGGLAAHAHCRVRTRGLDRQKPLVDDVRSANRWLIVVLDACRFDYFREHIAPLLDGQVVPVKSAGHDTFEYVSRCWSGEYPDTTYVSGATPVNSDPAAAFEDSDLDDLYGDYVPAEHIGTIVDEWRSSWDDSLGVCPPEPVTDATIAYGDRDRLVAHYFQPHAPYIGHVRELGHHDNSDARPREGDPVDKPLWMRLYHGDLSEDRLRAAYATNVYRVARELCRLVDGIDTDDRRVAVMADHGEALGEWGFYAHPRVEHPHTRVVPWCEIDGLSAAGERLLGVETDRAQAETGETTDASVEHRLEQLGYLA